MPWVSMSQTLSSEIGHFSNSQSWGLVGGLDNLVIQLPSLISAQLTVASQSCDGQQPRESCGRRELWSSGYRDPQDGLTLL